MLGDVYRITDEEGRKVVGYLYSENCSCVIQKNKEIRIFRERGVKDLYHLLKEESGLLKEAFVVDKVVGKAAAALMILGGVKEVYAGVISQPACQLLSRASIPTVYALEVPHIINRTQTDWCPLEKRCSDAETAEECLPIIEDFIQSLPK